MFYISENISINLEGIDFMNRRLQGFISGVATTIVIGATVVFASHGTQNVDITYRDIKINIDGSTVSTQREPFILKDNTYLPLRDMMELTGADIKWDDASSTISVYTDGAPVEEGDISTPIPTSAPTAKPSTDIDEFSVAVFNLTNEFRAENGLEPFVWSEDLSNVAKAHSDDMSENNFFSHTNKQGLSPFDRMKNYGIEYSSAAENISKGYKTPEAVVEGWKNSAGHRKNMLGSYTQIGVGYCEDGSYWTQCFAAIR